MPGNIEGVVVSVNNDGNLVTDISAEQIASAPRDGRVTVACDVHETNGIYDSDHQEQPATLLAIIGPSGYLELTIVGENMSEMLCLGAGEKVIVKW